MNDTPHQELLSASALTTFRLNGQFLALAEQLARPAGLTAARWQVLGAILHTPRSVSGIARVMGITRQSAQRTADQVVADRLADYHPNPDHKTAKLVVITDSGLTAVRRINPQHAKAAEILADRLGTQRWNVVVEALQTLSDALGDPTPITQNV